MRISWRVYTTICLLFQYCRSLRICQISLLIHNFLKYMTQDPLDAALIMNSLIIPRAIEKPHGNNNLTLFKNASPRGTSKLHSSPIPNREFQISPIHPTRSVILPYSYFETLLQTPPLPIFPANRPKTTSRQRKLYFIAKTD